MEERSGMLLGVSGLLRWALTGATLLVAVPAAADGPSLAASIEFGTTCARCHEGECSGRLTFDSDARVAAGHIRRHAGAIADPMVEELFALLVRMKTECAYPPVDVLVPADGNWSSALLRRLCIPSQRGCFVPLGKLKPGTYRVHMQLGEVAHVHAEVVTRDFEILLEEPLTIEAGESAVSFEASATIEPFLRLQSQDALRLGGVRLSREPR